MRCLSYKTKCLKNQFVWRCYACPRYGYQFSCIRFHFSAAKFRYSQRQQNSCMQRVGMMSDVFAAQFHVALHNEMTTSAALVIRTFESFGGNCKLCLSLASQYSLCICVYYPGLRWTLIKPINSNKSADNTNKQNKVNKHTCVLCIVYVSRSANRREKKIHGKSRNQREIRLIPCQQNTNRRIRNKNSFTLPTQWCIIEFQAKIRQGRALLGVRVIGF